jgi:hypothetical protein
MAFDKRGPMALATPTAAPGIFPVAGANTVLSND